MCSPFFNHFSSKKIYKYDIHLVMKGITRLVTSGVSPKLLACIILITWKCVGGMRIIEVWEVQDYHGSSPLLMMLKEVVTSFAV